MALILITDAPTQPLLNGQPAWLHQDGTITGITGADDIITTHCTETEYTTLLTAEAIEAAHNYLRLIEGTESDDELPDATLTLLDQLADLILDQLMDGEPAARRDEKTRETTQVQAIRDYKKALG
jgi:hypothetical protein